MAEPQQLPTLSEFVQSEDQKLPSLSEFVQKHDPDNYSYFGAKINSVVPHNVFSEEGREALNDAQRIFAQKQPFWNIVKAFGHGYGEQYSMEMDENIQATHNSFIKDYVQTQAPVGKALVDGFVLPAAKALWTSLVSAPFAGVEEALYQTGKEFVGEQFGRDLAAMPEAFPFEIYTRISEGAPLPHSVAKAKANGILENDGVWSGAKEPTPDAKKAMDEASIMAHRDAVSPGTTEPPPLTIHEVARAVAPETFREYDALSTKRQNLGEQIRSLSAARREEAAKSAPHNAAIAELQAKAQDANPRMAKKYQAKIEELTAQNESYVAEKSQELTPEINRLRGLYTKADYRMRDLAPEVSGAYREAEKQMPAPTENAVQPTESSAATATGSAEPAMSSDTPTDIGTPEPIAEPRLLTPEERNFIIEDFTKRVVEAGRPAEEATTMAELEAARYDTLSQLYPKYSAGEWYARESAMIRKGREGAGKVKARELAQKAQGKIRLATQEAKATITLFKTANASTLIHEKGHEWVDQLLRLADEVDAPAAMKADAATIRKYGKAGEDGVLSTRAHEKFARGFERWIMEGVAPSKELAGVFAKLQQWMNAIYQTVERLKSPINDDIRDVFDRLFAKVPEKTVIAPEVEAATPLADIHGASLPAVPGPTKVAAIQDNTPTPQTAQDIPALPRNVEETATGLPSQPRPIPIEDTSSVGEVSIPPPKEAPVTSPGQPLGNPKSDLIDKAGNIRLENLTDSEDVRQVMRQVAGENDNFMNARRGVVSDQEVSDLANAMGVSARTVNIEKLRAISVEDDIPLAVRIKVGRQMLVQSAQAARDAMQKVIDTKGSDEALMELADARRTHLMISETVAGITAEWGRAGRSFRDISKEQLGKAEEVTELFQRMTGMTMEEMRAMAKNPRAFDTPQKAAKLLQNSTKPGFGKMLLEYRQSAMLSNPLTHVKNIVSNAAMAVSSVVETAVASGVGKVLKSEDRVYLGEAKERLFAIHRGSIEGWQTAKAIMQDEKAIVGNRTVENIHIHAIPGKAGEIIRVPLRALSAEDEIFKGIAFRQEINALAYRTATKEGLSGDAFYQRIADIVQNPSEEMMEAARANADYQTLTQSLTGVAKKGQELINSNIILKNIVPFYRTNMNSLKYFVKDRSPLGLLSREVRENLSGKNGTIARDTQIARLAVGTSVLSLVSALGSQGLITGGGPRDSNERALLRMTGWQPYSVKIGDGYYSYEWLQGFSTPIGMAADVADVVSRGNENEDDLQAILAASASVLSKRIMDISSLTGVSDTVKALDNPESFGEKWIQNYLGSYVPGMIGQVARTTDPEARELRGNWLNPAMSRIPGLRQDLMPKRDVWGEVIISQGNFGPDMISPIYQSRINNDPVNQALISMGYFPSQADRKIRGVELSDQQYDDYSRIAGRLAKQRLNILISRPGFSGLPDSIRIKAASAIVNNSREQARKLIMMQNPDIVRQATENKIRELRGVK